MLESLRKIVPLQLRAALRKRQDRALESLPSWRYLQGLMSAYRTEHLVNVDPESFRARIDQFLQMQDAEMEGFNDPARQRDLSVRFHWGHHHDFGTFRLQGMMHNRHISLLATFMDQLHALPRNLEGFKVLDIGCWTGGTSLLLSKMGAQVVAIEEVKKYVEAVQYLKYAFNITNLEIRHRSLYECTGAEFQDAFDLILFAGVIYHLTDPILALRITFNALKDNGHCLVESAALRTRAKRVAYEGPTDLRVGEGENPTATGWNWFILSPTSLAQMMADVGYRQIRLSPIKNRRVFAVGTRLEHVDMLRAGLSVPDMR